MIERVRQGERRRGMGERDDMRGVSCVWCIFFFSSRRRHTRLQGDWSSDVCSSDLGHAGAAPVEQFFADALEHGERERGGAGVKIEDTFCSGSSHQGRHDSFLQKGRSEERRGGEEGRSRGAADHLKKKKKKRQESQTEKEKYRKGKSHYVKTDYMQLQYRTSDKVLCI